LVSPYTATRQDYAKNPTFFTKKTYTRFTGTLKREKVAMVYLRNKFNTPIHTLAEMFGRSTSLVQRALKFNSDLGTLQLHDERKMPNRIRLLNAQKNRLGMEFNINLWTEFLTSDEGEPP
jgi:hypothetical protein